MQKLLCVVALCLAVGCGPPDNGSPAPTPTPTPTPTPAPTPFAGTFAGALTDTSSCSDGSGGTNPLNATWILTQSGSSVAATINQPCQNIPGTAGTTSASFPAFNCQPFYNPNNGVTSTQHIQTLSLTISGASLTVNMTDRIDLSSSAGSGYCNNTYSGTFTKQ